MARTARSGSLPELWILTAPSAVLHYWRLFTPRAVVFDEIHYERFTGDYLSHSYLFDVHPPFGRMMIAGFARLLHIPATAFVQPVAEPVLRALPAAFGTALVPLVFIL